MLFEIPADFREFMERVASILDAPGNRLLDGDQAFTDEVGHGGRVETSDEAGKDLYRFFYVTADGLYRWEVDLRAGAIRSVAEGMLIDLEAKRHDIVRSKRREPEGDALLIWGEYGDDALQVRGHHALIEALDSLHLSAEEKPRMFRLWSTCDDQVVVVVWGERCALYVVESVDGYATTRGDRTQTETFSVADHDGHQLEVPFADCIPWDRARNALLNFMDNGKLGPEIATEGSLPTLLLMMGDVDRKAALAMRAEPPRKVHRSSLPRLATPVPEPIEEPEPTQPVEIDVNDHSKLSAWAKRLLETLHSRELIELGKANLDEITYQLGGLLQAHGIEAEHSIETADWLANEIGAVRGINKMFATGGDLQIALRRSREG
jgi:hypothetical protein